MKLQTEILLSVAWITSVLYAFAGGVAFCRGYWHFGPSVRISETMVDVCPPPLGPIYSVEDFITANRKVESFLQLKKGDYDGIDPHMFLVPLNSGYRTVWTSGQASKEFPDQLREAAMHIALDGLREDLRGSSK